ncbi:peptidyl-prolyl cis-trans isomerase C [Thecamonas trahens ATCC 50062]|uniref:Peptidyl-prolyl cis-trans isomerase n=1 Tax=Thecamonas trahens ATCC 50062 TaxID=461836 RepID=A0A0L0DP80_THETB|nr:peptidyl-prolyl cis-trans isomerase C [Thecamonas trahens ATCC 50062]KNC54107.1 peptidyl-prolyl cis-trans isomerase C [Thecamonas trahens ATCC 50062]|eukprot:XP_013753930.1 peptidyl-prolyl cis-trans isomerase C [Thecamonas trahens ATCC 50062]
MHADTCFTRYRSNVIEFGFGFGGIASISATGKDKAVSSDDAAVLAEEDDGFAGKVYTPSKPGRSMVWLDVEIDGAAAGRVVAEILDDVVPKTAANFVGLCKGTELPNGKTLTFAGHNCHRIIDGFIVQCGDITRGDGRGGRSIYPSGSFDDEPAGLALKHNARYLLQMANAGPNTNGSQFCFMLNPAPHLNGHHVVFGHVVDGFDVVDAMETAGTQSGVPSKTVTIIRTGVISTP